MLPEALLRHSDQGGVLVPSYLGAADEPWLRVLFEEHERFFGKPRRELAARLREPLPMECPPSKRRLACHVLDRILRGRTSSSLPPRKVRAVVFVQAAKDPFDRALVLANAAQHFGCSAAAIEEALFADLPEEQHLIPPTEWPTPKELVLRANLVLAQAFLHRATGVRLDIEGNARAVVRAAKLRRLLLNVTGAVGRQCTLSISGPFALFRHTLLYGRALGALLPPLTWCQRFRLLASCSIRGERKPLLIQTGDPIFPSAEPARYDSLLEERFAREFRRAAPDWDLVREPEPIEASGTLIFPDFVIYRRSVPNERWFLEIAGFWTRDYIERKLALLRSARLDRLILCVDSERNCAENDLPPTAKIVRFRKKVDPCQVLALVDGIPNSVPGPPPPPSSGVRS